MELKRITLSVEQQKMFQALKHEQIALDAFIRHVVSEGQQRSQGLVAKTEAAWSQAAKELNLDLTKVEYNLSDDGLEIVPARVRL